MAIQGPVNLSLTLAEEVAHSVGLAPRNRWASQEGADERLRMFFSWISLVIVFMSIHRVLVNFFFFFFGLRRVIDPLTF